MTVPDGYNCTKCGGWIRFGMTHDCPIRDEQLTHNHNYTVVHVSAEVDVLEKILKVLQEVKEELRTLNRTIHLP